MCGIVGYIGVDGMVVEKGVIEKMCNSILSRGPDERGIFVERNVGLGVQRLSIIDLITGQQPMHNEDKRFWIVFNGEIYNFRELKKELEESGHNFLTNSDTEIIVHLYEDMGHQCLEKLEGMFAIAIWDSVNEELFLARDRMGKKPLYYSYSNNVFLFASEIKAILQNQAFKKELSWPSLRKYLFFGYVPTPNTLFNNIYKVPAGSYLYLRKGKTQQINTYWKPDLNSKFERINEREAELRFIELIRKSVEKRMVSDVPIGAFLSGGVDSSLITALMCEMAGKENVNTFTIGFSENEHDESMYAQSVADCLGIKNHHVELFSGEDCLRLIPDILDYMDEPIADPSILPTYLLSKFTRKFVKVALSGDGGDELFAGYPKYFAHQIASKMDSLCGNVLKQIATRVGDRNLNFLGDKKKRFFKGFQFPPHIRNHFWIAPFSYERIINLFNNDFQNRLFEDIEFFYDGVKSADIVSQMLYLDMKLTFSDLFLVKVDRASMANSLEVRSPFLDRELMEFVNCLPTTFKVKRGETKYLLKKAAAKYVPRGVIYRRKMGFGIPLKRWITADLRNYVNESLSYTEMKKGDIFSPGEIRKILNEHYSGQNDNSIAIWTLVVFQHWHRKYMIANCN
jgi:asparagine synthase (glutamine-hydrolysing)